MNDKSSHQPTCVPVPAQSSFVVVTVVVIVMFLWAICFPLISLGLEDAPPLYYAGLRAVIAAMALLIPCWLICTSIVFVLWFWLLKQNELGRINVYSFLTTGFGLLMGFWFFNESFGFIELGGILVTLIGIALVGIKGEHQ
mgnify:CR=1 FL=1